MADPALLPPELAALAQMANEGSSTEVVTETLQFDKALAHQRVRRRMRSASVHSGSGPEVG